MGGKELRIGNYIYTYLNGYRCLCTVRCVDESGVRAWNFIEEVKDKTNIDNFYITKPIKLNVEWLLKLGFKPNRGSNDCFKKKIKGWFFSHELSTNTFYINDGVGYEGADVLRKIKYVHELQNLFYSLTNKELI